MKNTQFFTAKLARMREEDWIDQVEEEAEEF